MQIATMKNHQRFKFLSINMKLSLHSLKYFQHITISNGRSEGRPLIRPNQTDRDNQKDTVRALKLLTWESRDCN